MLAKHPTTGDDVCLLRSQHGIETDASFYFDNPSSNVGGNEVYAYGEPPPPPGTPARFACDRFHLQPNTENAAGWWRADFVSIYAADIDNPHECCTKCAETPGCMSFVLDRWQGSGKCQLYDTPDAKASNAGSAWSLTLGVRAARRAAAAVSLGAVRRVQLRQLHVGGRGARRVRARPAPPVRGREDFLLTGIDITADECNASRAWLHQSTTFVIDGSASRGSAARPPASARAGRARATCSRAT